MNKYDHYIELILCCIIHTHYINVMIFIMFTELGCQLIFFSIFQNQSAAGNVIQQINKPVALVIISRNSYDIRVYIHSLYEDATNSHLTLTGNCVFA